MTIYIAGPMTGIENYNFDAFHKAEKYLNRRNHRTLNPAKIGVLPDYGMYWPINRAMLDGADAIYMLRDWRKSKGAQKEFNYAVYKGINIYFEGGSIYAI